MALQSSIEVYLEREVHLGRGRGRAVPVSDHLLTAFGSCPNLALLLTASLLQQDLQEKGVRRGEEKPSNEERRKRCRPSVARLVRLPAGERTRPGSSPGACTLGRGPWRVPRPPLVAPAGPSVACGLA